MPATIASTLQRIREVVSVRVAILAAVAVIAAVGFAWIAHEVLEGEHHALEQSILLGLRRMDSPAADVVMRGASFVGAGLGMIIAIVLTATWAIRRGHTRMAVVLVFHALAVQLASTLLKLGYGRDRPTLFEEITLPSTYSFPSGHSMLSFAVYGAIAAIAVRLAPRLRWIVIPAAVVLVLVVGLSRMYLGVHWPLDVVGGYAAAAPLLAVTLYLMHRIRITRPGTPLA